MINSLRSIVALLTVLIAPSVMAPSVMAQEFGPAEVRSEQIGDGLHVLSAGHFDQSRQRPDVRAGGARARGMAERHL
jgi:hypothetical protein